MASAVFNYTAWLTRFPEFDSTVTEPRAQMFFDEATLYLGNGDGSPVQDTGQRLVLLNLLTAHIASLSGALEPGGKPSGLVGRITQATEGSVSVAVDIGLAPGTAAWFGQTSYGLSYWQMMAPYRSAMYVPAAPYITDPWALLAWRG